MTTATRPPEALARRVVLHGEDCLRHAGVARVLFAASRPDEGFVRFYDTLVLEFTPGSTDLQTRPSPRKPPAALVREALLLLHALSGFRDYAFHENFAFWSDTLAPDTGSALPVRPVRFPRVVLDWDPSIDVVNASDFDGVASQRLLEASVLALFVSPVCRRELSPKGRELLSALRVPLAAAPQVAIECVVSFRFARLASDTKLLVDAVLAAAAASASHDQNEFAWVGVAVARNSGVRHVLYRGVISSTNLRLLGRLSTELPVAVSLDVLLPRSHGGQPARPPLVAFLSAAIGVAGTELCGRLTLLDLTHPWGCSMTSATLDFASLCTLLPRSRTLQTLRVRVASNADVLWLLYAATHPLTATTSWRALELDRTKDAQLDWPRLCHVVQTTPTMLAALCSLLHVNTTSTSSRDGAYHVRRTAQLPGGAIVRSPDKRTVLVRLVEGCDVELCDTTTPLEELTEQKQGHADQDDLAVVVAGVGLGWVHKRHVAQLMDTRVQGGMLRSSCLATLTLGAYVASVPDMAWLLTLFGPPLRHLSALLYTPFAVRDVAERCFQLVSLDMTASLWRGFDQIPEMPALRSVGLVCKERVVAGCFSWLQSLPRLSSVRFQVSHVYTDTNWRALRRHLDALTIARARTLRFLTVIHNGPSGAVVFDGDDERGLVCAASSKRAWLSALARSDRDSARAQLGADLVRLIFDLAGPSVTRRVARNESTWPLDWCASPCLLSNV